MSLRPGGPRKQWSQVIKEVPAPPALQERARAWGPPGIIIPAAGATPQKRRPLLGGGRGEGDANADSPGPWRGPGAGVRVPRHPPCPPARVFASGGRPAMDPGRAWAGRLLAVRVSRPPRAPHRRSPLACRVGEGPMHRYRD